MLLIIFALFGRAAGHRSRSQALDGQFRVGGPLGARFDRISISFFEDRKSPLATKPGPARLSGLARQNDPVKNRPASVSYPPPLPPARAIPGAPLLSAAASLRGRVQILVKSEKKFLNRPGSRVLISSAS